MSSTISVTFYNPEVAADGTGLRFPGVATLGHEAWTCLPYRYLSEAGYQCGWSQTFPKSGIVIAHSDHLDPELRSSARHFIVCAQADRHARLGAAAEIVTNPLKARRTRLQPRFFIPHYSLKNMIPRDSGRLPGCRAMVYKGAPENLAPELIERPFLEWLAKEGLTFRIDDHREKWDDYRQFDAQISIRDFSDNPWNSKPPTKLINSWHAGVAAVVKAESAYVALGRDGEDCLIVRTLDDLKAALLRLRDSPELWARLVGNGRCRYEEGYDFARVTERWMEVLDHEILPRALNWFASPFPRLGVALRARARRSWQQTQTFMKWIAEK